MAAAEGGDSMRGRQLGRVALLKKEFGFIRQVGRWEERVCWRGCDRHRDR